MNLSITPARPSELNYVYPRKTCYVAQDRSLPITSQVYPLAIPTVVQLQIHLKLVCRYGNLGITDPFKGQNRDESIPVIPETGLGTSQHTAGNSLMKRMP